MTEPSFTHLWAPSGQKQHLYWWLLYNPASGMGPGTEWALTQYWYDKYLIVYSVDMNSGKRQFYVVLLMINLCKVDLHFRTSLGKQGYIPPISFLELRGSLLWNFNTMRRYPKMIKDSGLPRKNLLSTKWWREKVIPVLKEGKCTDTEEIKWRVHKNKNSEAAFGNVGTEGFRSFPQ